MNYIHSIFDNFATIRELFAGTYRFSDDEAEGASIDVFADGFAEDRKNLKGDRDKVVNDYSKAVKEKLATS
jgi:hypothetical protein